MDSSSLLDVNYYLILVTFISCACTWILQFASFVWCKWRLNRKPKNYPEQISSTLQPGVSIIKPLCGTDCNLMTNLRTYFTLDYSAYEILFCVQEESDPSVKIVNELRLEFPAVDAKLFIGGKNVGVNPKINNMQPAYEEAKHPLILISDSSIQMKEDTLSNMVLYLSPRIALVHQIPFALDRPGFAALREKIFFGTFHARPYLTSDLLGINCVNGMSCLVRKSVLDECGGFKAFGCYLAEDFFITKAIMDRGWKISLCSLPGLQNSGLTHLTTFHDRIMRWTKLRFAMLPFAVLLELITDCVVQGVIMSLAVQAMFGVNPTCVFVGHFALWAVTDWCLLRSMQNGPLPFSFANYILAWSCQTASAPVLLLNALLTSNTIRWKNGTFRVRWGGKVEVMTYNKPRCRKFSKDIEILIP